MNLETCNHKIKIQQDDGTCQSISWTKNYNQNHDEHKNIRLDIQEYFWAKRSYVHICIRCRLKRRLCSELCSKTGN